MNGVERKDARRHQRHGGGAKHPERDQKDEENHSHVRQKIGQVEPQRARPEKLVAEQISQRHHRAVIVGGAAEIAHERPHRGGEDFPQVMEVPKVGIHQDLVKIVVDKAVAQGVQIREKRKGNQNENVHCHLLVSQRNGRLWART